MIQQLVLWWLQAPVEVIEIACVVVRLHDLTVVRPLTTLCAVSWRGAVPVLRLRSCSPIQASCAHCALGCAGLDAPRPKRVPRSPAYFIALCFN